MAAEIEDDALAEDRCPFPRPFEESFTGCPAFVPMSFVGVDMDYRLLRPVLGCRHLEAAVADLGRFYGRCRLGNPRSRSEWLASVGATHLAELRAVATDYRHWVASRMPELWNLKSRWLAARRAGESDAATAHAERLHAGVELLIADAVEWVNSRSERLEKAGLSIEPVVELLVQATRHWAETDSAGPGYRVPEELLARFPAPVRLFIQAGRRASA